MTDTPPASPATAPSAAPPVPPSAAARPTSARIRFSARDLVNVAIFAVIYVVIVFAIAMLGVISPLVMLLTLPLSAIAAGIPYMLFLTRVRHAGMVTLFGVAVGAVYLVMGHPWQSTVITIVVSVLADVVLAGGGYASKRAAIAAYTVFSAWFIGPWIPMFLNREAYLSDLAARSMGAEYAAAYAQVVSTPAVLIMWAVTIVCGFLGGLLGSAALRKHFRKAGLA